MTRKTLYPEIEPYRSDFIKVSNLHTVYFEECGNPKGMPVLVIHGGPGGGISPRYRRFFDPKHYRIILVDQRGCGQSMPTAELRDNTTQDLVHDFELIRTSLGISKWMLFGGSWGSTLALVYAETHPECVTHLILRGIFLGVAEDLDWIYQKGASEIFPDYWQTYLEFIPENERHDLAAAYHRRLMGSDVTLAKEAAKRWSTWEAVLSRLNIDPTLLQEYSEDEFSLTFAKIESHYFAHRLFLKDHQILTNLDRIRHLPTVIIHGRYDLCCLVRGAWDLHRAWPESKLVIVPAAGHSVHEPGVAEALLDATEQFRQ